MPREIKQGNAEEPMREAAEEASRGDVDEHALVELHIYADNTAELYTQKKAILQNIERRIRKGTYDPRLAPKLWLYWIDAAAKRYTKEFDAPGGSSFGIFNKATREELARRIAEQEYAELMIQQRAHVTEEARRGQIDTFTEAYIAAALWSTNDESDEAGGEPLDQNYGPADIAPETMQLIVEDTADFQKRFGHLIENEPKVRGEDRWDRWELAGHDFWLTREGHGAGFWDGDWPVNGDALTKAAKSYGGFELYVGDDGTIYGPPPDLYRKRHEQEWYRRLHPPADELNEKAPMNEARRTRRRAITDPHQLGVQYAEDQLQSDYFNQWMWEQLSADVPDPITDARVIARNMLQQLGWDIARELDVREIIPDATPDDARAFSAGVREHLSDPKTREWLAERVEEAMQRVQYTESKLDARYRQEANAEAVTSRARRHAREKEETMVAERRAFAVGDKVEGGRPYTEDFDQGKVSRVDGELVEVRWQSGVTTREDARSLRHGWSERWQERDDDDDDDS